MRISRWWFRTRKDGANYRTLLSLKPKGGYLTRCQCDRCSVEFNREVRTKDFSLCPPCRTADRNRSKESRKRASEVFTEYYSNKENIIAHSKIAAARYKDADYAKKHRQGCKIRSADQAYRKKLSANAARGKLHAIKTSCGKQNIDIKDFKGFVTGLDVRQRELCKITVGKECLLKANYTCLLCGKKSNLHAHHLDGWHWCIDKRFDLNNLVCLCHGCHSQFHKEYGNKNNTREQFDKFRLSKQKAQTKG